MVEKDKIITFTLYCILLESRILCTLINSVPSTWNHVGAYFVFLRIKMKELYNL